MLCVQVLLSWVHAVKQECGVFFPDKGFWVFQQQRGLELLPSSLGCGCVCICALTEMQGLLPNAVTLCVTVSA